MAGGPLLHEAIHDLNALPEDAHERRVASQILLGLRHALGGKPNRTNEEQEIAVDLEKIGERLVNKARKEGRLIQARASVHRLLALRELAVSPADEARIDNCTDLATLERWHKRAVTADSAAEALHGGENGSTRPRRRRAARSS